MRRLHKSSLIALALAVIVAALTRRERPHDPFPAAPSATISIGSEPLEDVALATSAPPAVVRAPAVVVDDGYERHRALYKQDVPLAGEEETRFFAEVSHVFLDEVPAVVDVSTIMPDVIKINERYRRGVRSILDDLASAPAVDEEVKPRIARVDYLKYRIRWDERARGDVAALVGSDLTADVPVHYKAVVYTERLELIEELAAHDWSLALQTLSKIKDPFLAQKAAQTCYAKRVNEGVSTESSEEEVKLAYPGFKNQAGS
jgi:hypothetical protein